MQPELAPSQLILGLLIPAGVAVDLLPLPLLYLWLAGVAVGFILTKLGAY
jgi:hypothetical protein